MLATPAYDGRVDVGYTHSLIQSIRLCAQHGIALFPVWWPGEALVQHARNMLVTMALEAGVADVIFVDSDQEWDPQNIVDLLKHDVAVVGAAVRKREDAESYNIRAKSLNFATDIKTGLWIVDGIGTGFLRLDKSAMEALWSNSEPYNHNGTKCRMIFDVGVVDGRLMGEDVYMCEKLTALGFNIYVDSSFTVAHRGAKTFTGDVKSYVANLKKAAVKV